MIQMAEAWTTNNTRMEVITLAVELTTVASFPLILTIIGDLISTAKTP